MRIIFTVILILLSTNSLLASTIICHGNSIAPNERNESLELKFEAGESKEIRLLFKSTAVDTHLGATFVTSETITLSDVDIVFEENKGGRLGRIYLSITMDNEYKFADILTVDSFSQPQMYLNKLAYRSNAKSGLQMLNSLDKCEILIN